MRVAVKEKNGRPVVSKPIGLELLDREEILRLRYSGMLSGDPQSHFLGSDMERSFGEKEDGRLLSEEESVVADTGWRARWERVNGRDSKIYCPVPVEGHHKTQEQWKTAFYEIGRISSLLGLPDYIRDETARIYTNLRRQGKTTEAGVSIEEQLAKIAYLACLIHRLPRKREDIERELKEIYGFGIGEIPQEFVKALNTRWMKFHTMKTEGQRYLCAYERIGRKRIHRRFGQL